MLHLCHKTQHIRILLKINSRSNQKIGRRIKCDSTYNPKFKFEIISVTVSFTEGRRCWSDVERPWSTSWETNREKPTNSISYHQQQPNRRSVQKLAPTTTTALGRRNIITRLFAAPPLHIRRTGRRYRKVREAKIVRTTYWWYPFQ